MESDLLKTSIGGIIRHIVGALGAALATKGTIGESDVEILVGAALALFSVAWSVVQKRLAAQKEA